MGNKGPQRSSQQGVLNLRGISEAVIRKFKARCASEGIGMYKTIEQLMIDYTKHAKKETEAAQ